VNIPLDGIRRHSADFPRGGERAWFGLLVERVPTTASLHVEIEHRDGPDDPWTCLGAFSPVASPGLAWVRVERLRHWLRFSVEGAGAPGATAEIGIPSPMWDPAPPSTGTERRA
jgi:hypothetical protein